MPGTLKYSKAVFIALDQFINTIFGGWPDETMSSVFYRWHKNNVRHWPMKVLDFIASFFGDKEHCKNSYLSEKERRQYPPELRL